MGCGGTSEKEPSKPVLTGPIIAINIDVGGTVIEYTVHTDEQIGSLKQRLISASEEQLPPSSVTRLVFSDVVLADNITIQETGMTAGALISLEWSPAKLLALKLLGSSVFIRSWPEETILEVLLRSVINQVYTENEIASSRWFDATGRQINTALTVAEAGLGTSSVKELDAVWMLDCTDPTNTVTYSDQAALLQHESTAQMREGVMRRGDDEGDEYGLSWQGLSPGEQLVNKIDSSRFELRWAGQGIQVLEAKGTGMYVGCGAAGDGQWDGLGFKAVLVKPDPADQSHLLRMVPARNGLQDAHYFSLESVQYPGFLLNHCGGLLWFFDRPANNEESFRQESTWSFEFE